MSTREIIGMIVGFSSIFGVFALWMYFDKGSPSGPSGHCDTGDVAAITAAIF